MTREEFFKLVHELRPYISPDKSLPNYRALTVEKKLAVALYYLKDTGSLAMTANTFGIAICTTSRVIFQVCQTISSVLGPKYLRLPKTTSEMRQKVSEFKAKFGSYKTANKKLRRLFFLQKVLFFKRSSCMRLSWCIHGCGMSVAR